jgi:hypothetical protein
MKKNVLRLLILTIMVIIFSLFHINGQKVLPESRHYKLEKLTEGIYAAIHNNQGGYAICNAGIIDLGDKTVIIDPFISPAPARDLKQHAEYLTGKTITLVLNLDPHSDHTSGNQVFVPGADILSTPNARKYIENHFAREYYFIIERSTAMKLKSLLITKAIVCLCLGVPILLVPNFVYSIFGATLAAGGVFAAREYGASMMGNLMLTWSARNSQESDARWAIILALFVYDVIGAIVSFIAILSGAINALGWLVLALYLFLASGFGYFLLPKRKPLYGN